MKKQKKTPFIIKFFRTVFRLLEKVNLKLSGRFALYLFLHPPRYKRPSREEKCYVKAQKSFIQVEGKKVAVFEWGEGPSVWIMHGWAGRATQLSSFINQLVKKGYHVIGIDAPAHGDSEGKDSSVLHFEKSLKALYNKYGKAYAYIGHSLGGAVGFFAMKNGITLEKYISISTPTIPDLILHEAFDKLGAKQKSLDAMCQIIHDRLGAPFSEFTATYWAKTAPSIPYLILHDKNDKDAEIEHAYALHKILPDAHVHYTEGLGHVRILRDEKVVNEVIEFIRS